MFGLYFFPILIPWNGLECNEFWSRNCSIPQKKRFPWFHMPFGICFYFLMILPLSFFLFGPSVKSFISESFQLPLFSFLLLETLFLHFWVNKDLFEDVDHQLKTYVDIPKIARNKLCFLVKSLKFLASFTQLVLIAIKGGWKSKMMMMMVQ